MEEQDVRGQSNYYAIIPASVRYDERLRANEKIMYGEITALSNKNGYCNASNTYFSKLYKVYPSAISKWIQDLEQCGYIEVEYLKDGKEIKQRNIKITGIHKYEQVFTKAEEGYSQKQKENSTSINNTSINKRNIKENIPYQDIITYLNGKTGYSYKDTTKKTRDLIKARYNEGFLVEDFKQVIDTMCSEWLNDPKMRVYLRPETLFGTKFESYLNREMKQVTLKDVATNKEFMNKAMKGFFE